MDMNNLPEKPMPVGSTSPDDAAALDAALAEPPEVEESDEDYDVEELADGTAVARAKRPAPAVEATQFGSNLAAEIEPSVLNRLGIDLHERIASDKKSREKRDAQQAEGIKRTGLANDKAGADFEGSSVVVHPMLAKGCVDFASKAIKELYPASGPCKMQIIGKSDEAKISKAERKKTYVNWQLTTQVQENRAEFERLLSQLPLGGSQYKRWWHDASMKRLRTETVFIDDVFLPYNHNDFYTSPRVTHRQYFSSAEIKKRVASGMYAEGMVYVGSSMALSEKSASREASESVEGSEEDTAAYNDEGLREVYMCYVDLVVEGDKEAKGALAPYIAHVDEYNQRVIGLYRNWKPEDELRGKKHWMVEYTFIPWRGAYGLGLNHLIGSMSTAATGALRALLDSAHIANFPGGLKLKSGRTTGQTIQVNATELAEIDVPTGVDDIRKAVMPFPFPGPSAVLQQLLEWLTQQAETVVATASEKIAEGGANMPMGTALALIEQGSVNFSAIHARIHASLKKELEIVQRLNSEYLSDQETVEDLGELVVSREDFTGPFDVIPVSDPNIFSESQRYAQIQAVMQLKTDPQFAPYFKADKLLQRALKLLQFPAPEDIANLPKDPERLDALEENYVSASLEPQPLKSYQDQDHLAHLEAHTHFMSSPMFGSNPLIAPQALPALIQHCKDHLLDFYKQHSRAAAEAFVYVSRAQGTTVSESQAYAKGSAFADQIMAQLLGPMVMPALEAAMAAAAKFAPQPPTDPNTALQEATKKELKTAELANAEKLKMAELAYHKERDTADREANAAATEATKFINDVQQENDRRLAQFSASIDIMKTEQQANVERMITEINAQNAKELEVLKAALAANATLLTDMQAAPEAQPAFDIPGMLKPILDGMNTSNDTLRQQLESSMEQSAIDRKEVSDVMGSMVNALAELHKTASAPRSAEYIIDPVTKKRIGARSTIERTVQ